jgi:hypothetical protein
MIENAWRLRGHVSRVYISNLLAQVIEGIRKAVQDGFHGSSAYTPVRARQGF